MIPEKPEEQAVDPDPEVLALLQLSSGGDVKPSMTNIRRILEADRRWRGRLRYDTFLGAVMLDHQPVTDALVANLRMAFGIHYGFEPAKSKMWEVLELVGRAKPHNRLHDFLDALQWDGRKRIDGWLTRALKVEDSEIHRAFARRWMVGAVARAFKPGCKLDTVLLLVGPRGVGKSTVFKLLAGDDWFSDTEISLRSKDAYMQLQRVWIYEVAEMTGFTGATAERVKAFVTSTHDKYRPPYGRSTVHEPRSRVFIATTNDEQPLTDPTGSRRFWPVATSGPLDRKWVTATRDQLWAEAVVAYRAGERWHLTDAEERLRAAHAMSFERMDPWTRCIEVWAGEQTTDFTLQGLLAEAVGI